MKKPYTFKLDTIEDADFIKAIELWQADDHTIVSMVKTLLSKYHGLELPAPSNEAYLLKEVRRLDQVICSMAGIVAEMNADFSDRLRALEATTGKVNQSSLAPLNNSLPTYPIAVGD